MLIYRYKIKLSIQKESSTGPQSCLFLYCHCLYFHATTAELGSCNRDHTTCKSKIFTIWLFTEVSWPCLYRAQSAHITLWGKQISGVTLFIGERSGGGGLERKSESVTATQFKKTKVCTRTQTSNCRQLSLNL